MMLARPCEAITKITAKRLTAEVKAAMQRLCELRPHFDQEVLRLLQLVLAPLHGGCDEGLEVVPVKSEDDIADPLAVDMHPVSFVGQMLQKEWVALRMGEDVLNREALYLWESCDHRLVSLYVL